MTTHYQTLGVARSASSEEIRSAYRKLVLAHHPDRSQAPESKSVFLAATEAYGVLSDATKKREYDAYLERIDRRTERDEAEWQERRKRREEAAQRAREARATTQTRAAVRDLDDPPAPPRKERRLSEMVAEMKRMYALGRPHDAERVARDVLDRSPRNPEAFATLGDIAATRGQPGEALKMYAFASQYDPKNPVYQRRREELQGQTTVRRVATGPRQTTVETKVRSGLRGHWSAPLFGFIAAAVAATYAAWHVEPPILPVVPFISSWTLSMFLGLFAAGMGVGAGLSGGAMVDRFYPAGQTANPAVVLGAVAMINFWLAALISLSLGVVQDRPNPGVTRLIVAVAGVTMLAMAVSAGFGHINPFETLLWGGNIVYLGALCGWLFADSLRG